MSLAPIMRLRTRLSRRTELAATACAAALSLLATPAGAQSALDQRFSEGFSMLRFDPAPAGDRFFAVNDASASDAPQIVRAMLLGHYTLRPTLVRVDADTGERREIVASQLYTHLNLSLVPLPWLLVNLDAPLAAVQTGEGPAAPDSPVFGDLRLGARARVVGSEHAPFSFAPGVDAWLPTGSEDNLTGDGSVRVMPKLIVSGRASAFIYAVNGGFLLREYLDTGSLEVGNSLSFGAAAGVLLFDDVLQVGGELHGSGFLASERGDNFSQSTSPLEALFGAKVRASDWSFGAGIGPSLSDAPGTAPRVVFGISYAPVTPYPKSGPAEPTEAPLVSPKDGDGDGVPDDTDACPEQAGQASAVGSLNGCPAPAPTSADQDGDGVPDTNDACPADRGVDSPDPALRGCPPVDRDHDGVSDSSDACPDKSGARSADASRNGCPEGPLDTDEDGLADDKDACRREAASQTGGANGCPGEGPAEATFAGFRPGQGGAATVFVQLTDAVKIEVSEGQGEVTYLMKGAQVLIRNNRNPLIASEFDSAVTRAALLRDKDGVKLVLRLKAQVKLSHRLMRVGKGAVLEVDVPPPPPASAAPGAQ
jgi:OmpA-OmpF porin, OOP family